MNYGDAGDFHYDPPTVKYSSRYGDQPQHVSSGTLDGYAWSLGTIDEAGWWQTEFRVVVQDNASVADGVVVYNYGKLSWETTGGSQSSGRDIATITYTEPELTIDKNLQSTSTPFGAGSDVNFRIVVTNTGTTAANNVLVYDTLPVGMRDYDPTAGAITVYRGTTLLTRGVDYTVSYAAGVLTFDFDDAGPPDINTPLPPTSGDNYFQIDYTAKVDNNVGAGRRLTNTGRATWSCQRGGSSPNRDYGPVLDSVTTTLPSMSMTKAIVSPAGGIVAIGETLTYRLTITVPANNIAYSPELLDTIYRDGLEYVAGTTQLTDTGGTPPPRRGSRAVPPRPTPISTGATPILEAPSLGAWTLPSTTAARR